MSSTVLASASHQTGARWIRAALQVNPFAYIGKGSPSTKFADENAYNSALLDVCIQEGIELIAITDHWCVDSAVGLIADAAARGITALPGFEASSSEGIHLLVIFEVGTKTSDINAAIGVCGATPGCANGTTGKPYKEILESMSDRGALVIPAHVNVPNSGMLTGRTGVPLVQMIRHKALHAIGITPSVGDTKDQKAILSGTKPFDRDHPLAEVFADDISHPDTLKTPGGTSWFKMSAPCLASLQHAVHIPITRVATVDPTSISRATIREISWLGGFLDGVTVDIAEDLTAFIGGRGTGKSTVIESLRFALGIVPLGSIAKKDHASIVADVLKSGTTVRVVVDAISPNHGQYVIERTVPNQAVVIDSSGTATSLRPEDVIGAVEIFGQHELAELAQDKPSVARMLERFSGPTGDDATRRELARKLAENRESLNRAETDREALEDELSDIPRLQEQVDRFAATDLAKRLADLSRLQQDSTVFAEAADKVAEAGELIESLTSGNILATLDAEIPSIKGSSQEVILTKAENAAKSLGATIRISSAALIAAAEAAAKDITAAEAEWEAATRLDRAAHSAVLRTLADEGADPDKYLKTTAALERLKAKSLRRTASDAQIAALLKERKALLNELTINSGAISKNLANAIREANATSTRAVSVRPIPSPDRDHIKSVIETGVAGPRTQIMSAVMADDFSPQELAASARAGGSDLEAKFAIKGAQQRALLSAGEPLFRQLEELTVGQAVDVYLDTSIGGATSSFRRLDQLSKGQRATALLLLLLGASMSPLVIDQPEDDLDNRFVYDEIVRKLRELKGLRQVITSTHNANIPVLGDAELVICLEGDGQKAWPVADGVGSMDNPVVLALAEDLLEGGRDAFDARQHLYGF